MISDGIHADRSRESATDLKEDSLIQERVEILIVKSNTAVGVMSSDFGMSSWQAATLGDVRWILSNEELPVKREHDPP